MWEARWARRLAVPVEWYRPSEPASHIQIQLQINRGTTTRWGNSDSGRSKRTSFESVLDDFLRNFKLGDCGISFITDVFDPDFTGIEGIYSHPANPIEK